MIGYYIHHQGSGHRTRAQAVINHLDTPVVALTSLDTDLGAGVDVLRLERDDHATHPTEVTAHGALHWVPRRDRGLRDRMAQIAEFVTTRSPSAMVVDVSVEVAVFVRTMGVPVVVVAMPGRRDDAAHQLAYRLADAIIAPWPEHLYRPDWLERFRTKTTFTGGISRHDGRAPAVDVGRRADVLVMSGTGGVDTAAADLATIRAAHPGLVVRGLGPAFGTWVDDPWPDLCAAGLVVINAGQGSVADVACAGRPALVMPQQRPFDEQVATAHTLCHNGLARVCARWPSAREWESVVDRPPVTDWSAWRTRGAARRAADAILASANR